MSTVVRCDFCQLPVPGALGHAGALSPDQPVYCCYGCSFAAQVTRARGEGGQATWLLTRLGVAVFLSMAVMMFSMYLYRQEMPVDATAAAGSPLAYRLASVMRYLSLLFATPVFVMLGLPILTTAVEQFRRRVVSTDALVVLGVLAAFVYSYVSTLRDHGATYYETGCGILVFMTLGRWFEANSKLKASAAIQSLHALLPSNINVTRAGQMLAVAPADVLPDDLVHVAAGERIPVDGQIESGAAHVDEQIVSGESVPIERRPGDAVRAGTLSVDGALVVRTTTAGAESTLGRLIRLLEDARQSKSRYERLADRIASAFIPITVIVAAVAAVLGARRGGADDAILAALAVLLIACPCALGIATPMAVWVALGHAARRHVLFRNAEAVEILADVRAVCFDKTGTLTTGAPIVSEVVARAPNGPPEATLIGLAAGLARTSIHALSRGLIELAQRRGEEPVTVADARTLAGRGVIGTSASRALSLGSVELMRERGLVFEPALEVRLEEVKAAGSPVACLGWDGKVQGLFVFSESIRPEARTSAEALNSLGCTTRVLTGDHRQRGAAVAAQIGVETLAELSPQDKLDQLQRIRSDVGKVAMVGDGLNDAPALAAADVGIAMGCGADVTRESADVCLLGNDLRGVPWALQLARKTVRTVRVNLFWAFVYNIAGMTLALTGRLSPVYAAGAMVVSSLLVAANSLAIGREPRAEGAS